MGLRKMFLSSDGLLETVRRCFGREKFVSCPRSHISWQDCLMSGLAIFSLKFPSLLQFDKEKNSDSTLKRNLKNLYGIQNAPSDTCLRERLDLLSIEQIRRPFKQIFAHLKRLKCLEQYKYLDDYYIVSMDGTGQFSSNHIHCQACCVKNHRSGEVTYYHQMLGAAIVHPDKKIVLPLAPEPIVKSDGSNKNDCERNAGKRLLVNLRGEHPDLKLLVVEDGLASNFPHLKLLDDLGMAYIIGVKAGDHDYLFDWIKHLKANKHTQIDADGTCHEFSYYRDVPLNDSNNSYRVNVIEYTEINKKGQKQHFSWVTRLAISDDNVYAIMRAGRARWKIENETFNTIKTKGYNFEHNYGHGNKNLCSVLSMLLMLAFLIDQVRELEDEQYQAARKRKSSMRALFEDIRALIQYFVFGSWGELYTFVSGKRQEHPPPTSLPG